MKSIRGILAIRNVAYLYAAQLVQLAFNLVMAVAVPMVIGLHEYSYWQLFLFYSTYVGVLHLGLNDGIYLKYGGMTPDESQESLISNQLWISIGLQAIILACMLFFVSFVEDSKPRIFVLTWVALYALISNTFTYCGSLLQAINRIRLYSISLVIDKLFVLLFIIAVILGGGKAFQPLIIGFTMGKLVAASFLLIQCHSIFLRKISVSWDVFVDMVRNISSGANLMLANISSTLIIGVGRFFIDIHYPIKVFGIFSFSLTMVGFVLLLLSQIGTSVFPILKSKKEEYVRDIYPTLNDVVSRMTPFSFLLYPIIYYVVYYFLNKYTPSLCFCVYLMPLCIFEAQTSMLYNTYMKVLRKERMLFVINALCMLLSLLLSALCVFVFENLQLMALSLSVCVVLKSQLLHWYICKSLQLPVMENLNIYGLFVVALCTLLLCLIPAGLCSFGVLILVMLFYGLTQYNKTKSQFLKLFLNPANE